MERRTLLATAVADFNGDGYADQAVGIPGEDIGTFIDAGAVQVIYGSAEGLTARNDYWHQNRSGVPDAAEDFDQFGFALAAGDFNDDGFSDLAIGVPGEGFGAALGAGAVTVIYGSPAGLSVGPTALRAPDFLTQGGVDEGELDDLLDVAETNDRFGQALAAGNFNLDADAADDLAIGAPGENNISGAVHVVYGSAIGLSAAGEQFFTQSSQNVEGTSSSNDEFGFSLAAGYLNADDNADLAIGVPGEGSGAGAVNVLYSAGAIGLSATPVGGLGEDDQLWDQVPLLDSTEGGDRFGQSLAAADFNGDGIGDLAVGVPTENISASDDGAVNVIFGQFDGLDEAGNLLLTQQNSGETNEAGDQFGFSLAAGDFDHDGFIDLAIGIPFEDIGGAVNVGAVSVRYAALLPQIWTQNSPGIHGVADPFDEFGEHLTAADFNGDGATDLAVGVPGDNVGLIDNAGALNVIYGDPSIGSGGLSGTFIPSQIWDQQKLGRGVAEPWDRFGGGMLTLSALPFLAIQSPAATPNPPPVAPAGEDAGLPAPPTNAPPTPAPPPPVAPAAVPPAATAGQTAAAAAVESSPAEEEKEPDSVPVFSSQREMLFSLFASARKGRRGR